MSQLRNRLLKQQKQLHFPLRATFHLYWVFFSTRRSQVPASCVTKAWWEEDGLLEAKTGAYFANSAFEDQVSSQLSPRVGVTIFTLILPLAWLPKTLWPGYRQGKHYLSPNCLEPISKSRAHPLVLSQRHTDVISSFES